MRAVRFNVARGGSADLDDLERLARRVYDLDPVNAIGAIVDVNPTALMVGTDLDLIRQALPPEHVADVFWNNAEAFYVGPSSA